MFLYRATSRQYLQAFNGMGASFLNGGRWNRRHQPVLYFATTPSLARMEMANYLPSPRLIPKDFVLAQYELDDTASVQRLTEPVPEDWDWFPYPESTQRIGGQWLDSASSVGLLVPSVSDSLGVDQCMVINPLHPDISLLTYRRCSAELYNLRVFIKI